MRVDGLGFEIPNLVSNPFSAMPLEGSKSDLYVGRLDIRGRLAQNIRFRSTGRILMVGDLGSGRTSLLRCSASEAPVSVHIDHISASNPHESLLQRMYSELVGYDLPSNSVELVNKMVEFSHSFNGNLPLIVIDTPNVEDSVLYVALRDVLPSLERLQAVIVVVVESKQKMNLQDNILHSFDKVETLSPLSIDEVQALIEKRIRSVSTQNFTLDLSHARAIHSKTGGLPLEVVKFMRDAIDNSILADSGIILQEERQNHLLPDESDTENTLLHPDVNSLHDANSDIIDASVPWDKRELGHKPSMIEPPANLFDFDLDLEELSESQEMDAPVDDLAYSANPDTEEIIIADSRPKPHIDAGAFGGLLGRTREFEDAEKTESENMVNQDSDGGTQLWISEDMVVPEERVEFEEHNSAELIHDEIGIEEEVTQLEEYDSSAFNQIKNQKLSVNESDTLNKIVALLSNLVTDIPIVKAEQNDRFLESLLNLTELKFRDKIDYPLNPSILSSLNSSESYVISVARVRKYSPSDSEILQHLGIKRPRLSQISNKLLKSGILNAQMKGRSRYYELTQSAKAQLIAWGVIGGDD